MPSNPYILWLPSTCTVNTVSSTPVEGQLLCTVNDNPIKKTQREKTMKFKVQESKVGQAEKQRQRQENEQKSKTKEQENTKSS